MEPVRGREWEKCGLCVDHSKPRFAHNLRWLTRIDKKKKKKAGECDNKRKWRIGLY